VFKKVLKILFERLFYMKKVLIFALMLIGPCIQAKEPNNDESQTENIIVNNNNNGLVVAARYVIDTNHVVIAERNLNPTPLRPALHRVDSFDDLMAANIG